MLSQMSKLLLKYREVIMYLVFGVLTTIVNYVVYLGWTSFLPGKHANIIATCVAWVVSVLFAYFTNRKWVFKSKMSGFLPRLKECGAFFAGRGLTGLLDLGIMYVAVDLMGFDGRIIKLLSNVLVIIINYILSKFLVFKKA